jgi:hypothetical protein
MWYTTETMGNRREQASHPRRAAHADTKRQAPKRQVDLFFTLFHPYACTSTHTHTNTLHATRATYKGIAGRRSRVSAHGHVGGLQRRDTCVLMPQRSVHATGEACAHASIGDHCARPHFRGKGQTETSTSSLSPTTTTTNRVVSLRSGEERERESTARGQASLEGFRFLSLSLF